MEDRGPDFRVQHQQSNRENYKRQYHGAEKDRIPESVAFVWKDKRPAQESQAPAQYHDPRKGMVTQNDPRDALSWTNGSQKRPEIFQWVD